MADINVAEGKKRARVLASEAEKTELINQALGQAEAMQKKVTKTSNSSPV